jgi:hypothetical protein
VKTTPVAAVVAGIWLAPTAYADPQDQLFQSFLAEHKVAVDTNTAIKAAHIACAQIADGEALSTADAIVSQQFPTINGNEYWIVAGHRRLTALNSAPHGISSTQVHCRPGAMTREAVLEVPVPKAPPWGTDGAKVRWARPTNTRMTLTG